jgi:hypothetical protein
MSERAKVTPGHLSRHAIVYLRQSSAAQVERNRESTEGQYALALKARELGWPDERIIVIDEDLGISGSGLVARSGFARLTAEVALARVGLVLGLEVSRLARNNAEWYRLIDLAGLTDTLIGDADGIYHPAMFNDERSRAAPAAGPPMAASATRPRGANCAASWRPRLLMALGGRERRRWRLGGRLRRPRHWLARRADRSRGWRRDFALDLLLGSLNPGQVASHLLLAGGQLLDVLAHRGEIPSYRLKLEQLGRRRISERGSDRRNSCGLRRH